MRPEEVKHLLARVAGGEISADEAFARLAYSPVDDLGFAQLDLHREMRQGVPEAIYAEGKTAEEVVTIAQRLLDKTTGPVIATRVPPATAIALDSTFASAQVHERARLVVLRGSDQSLGRAAVVAAGTSDLPVAEEAAVTGEALGIDVERIVDVGVAGVHRLLNVQDSLAEAEVVIVVAGMEGALASLVGGLVAAPVVAVPTSVGYGASFQGLAALLAMLTSCAAGIAVTNIDNGFGAAVFAAKVLGRSR
jgi:pyridinium-3,5-biscarboxylic acid mononucleotide synthase